MQKILFFIILLSSLSISAKSRFVSYTEAFDVFEIVDHLSGWHPSTRKEYFKYFNKNFKLTLEDKQVLENYRIIRKKYYKEYPDAVDSLFSEEAIAADILSRTFVRESTVDKALLALKKGKQVKVEDLKELAKIYRHFKPQVSKIVKEGALLKDEQDRLNKLLKRKKVISNIKKLDRFFDLPTHRIKRGRIKLVWWPGEEKPLADFRAGRLILRLNPVTHAEFINEDFVMQALVHSLFATLSKNKKENFSKAFLAACPKITEKKVTVFERYEYPLIIAMSRFYLASLADKRNFNPYELFEENAWVDVYSKYLYGLVSFSIKKKGKFDREFITNSASYCAKLTDI